MVWAPDYLTLPQAKAFLRVNDAVDDAEISGWITSASRAIDDLCNRQFGNAGGPVTRVYRRTPYYDSSTGLWTLEIDDLMSTTGFTVNTVAYASSSTVLLPDNAPIEGRPWTRLGFTISPVPQSPGAPYFNTLVGPFGWTAVPTQVPTAAKLQLSRWNARRDSPYGVAGSPEQGSEIRLLRQLDPDVGMTLKRLTRRRRAG